MRVFASVAATPAERQRVLWKLGLAPAEISTQILPPEPLAQYIFEP